MTSEQKHILHPYQYSTKKFQHEERFGHSVTLVWVWYQDKYFCLLWNQDGSWIGNCFIATCTFTECNETYSVGVWGHEFVLFICGVFYDAVSAFCWITGDCGMMNWKVFGRKHLWPKLMYVPRIFLKGMEKNNEKFCHCPGWDLNPSTSQIQGRVLPLHTLACCTEVMNMQLCQGRQWISIDQFLSETVDSKVVWIPLCSWQQFYKSGEWCRLILQ